MSVAHTAPDIFPAFADINEMSAKAKKMRDGEFVSRRRRSNHRKVEFADSFVDALFSDLSHLDQHGLYISNDCGAEPLSNGHEFTLMTDENVEIIDGGLDFSAPANDNVAVTKTRSTIPVAFISLLCHAAIASIFLFAGFTITQPMIEGGEAVAITIVGDTTEKSAVAGAAAASEPLPQIPDVLPIEPNPAPVSATAEPAPPKPDLVIEKTPAETVLTTDQPSATSVVAPAPLTIQKNADTKPIKKPEPLAEPVRPPKKTVQEPVKKKAAKQQTDAPVKPAKKTSKKALAKNVGDAGNEKAKNAGKSATDQKQGSRDGAAKGVAAQKSAGAKSGAIGNADASNYAGLVQRKISRTRRRPISGSGQAVVSFIVSQSGGVSGVSITSSSGNPTVDAAAIDHIRRSSPFPAPPAGAQTRFQIPIRIN